MWGWWVPVGGCIEADRKGVHTGFSKRKRKLWGKHACVMLFLSKSVACGTFLPEQGECAGARTRGRAGSQQGGAAAEALASAWLVFASLRSVRGAWGSCGSAHARTEPRGDARARSAELALSEGSEVGSRTACGG